MKNKTYLKLQLKSALKSYPVILLITSITILSIAITCLVLLNKNSDKNNKSKISLGVVGDTSDSYFEIGFYALENLDDSKFFIEIEEYEEKDAIKALKNREISGYVNIPDNYINDIFWGRNTPAKYVTLNSPEGFGSIISTELAEMVSKIVTQSQIGMYSMQDVAHDYNKKDLNKKIDNLMLEYINAILNRSSIFNIEVLGISDQLSIGAYYICGLIIFFLLLWGISCNKIFSSKSIALARLLKAHQMKTSWQVFCEYLAYLSITILTLLIFAIIFGIVIQSNNFNIPELFGVSVASCVFFVLGSLPVIAMITFMQFAFYELVPHTVGSVILQFLLTLGLGYICGCFYPITFFPEAVQTFAYYLPTGIGFSYLRKLMSASDLTKELLITTIYTLAFALIAVSARNYRIAGDIK